MSDGDFPASVNAVVFFCVDEAGQVLLANRRRGDTALRQAHWYTGSGGIEPGEEPDAACVREVREEFGATPAEPPTYLGSRTGALDSTKGRSLFIVHDYLVRVRHADVRNAEPKEHTELVWRDAKATGSWPTPWHTKFAEFLQINYGTILRELELKPLRAAPIMR